MALTYLDFERNIAELDNKIALLTQKKGSHDQNVSDLKEKSKLQLKSLYSKLGAWEKTQVARHPSRPHFSDYINSFVTSPSSFIKVPILFNTVKICEANSLVGAIITT